MLHAASHANRHKRDKTIVQCIMLQLMLHNMATHVYGHKGRS